MKIHSSRAAVALLTASIALAAAWAYTPDPTASGPSIPPELAVLPDEGYCQEGCVENDVLAACFMPGTPKRLVSAVNHYMDMIAQQTQPEGTVAYHLGPRWSPPIQGNPITIRWSIVPLGLSIPGGGAGEPTGANMLQTTLINVFGSVDAGLQRFRLVFDRWQALTGITFIEVSDDGAGWGSPGPLTGGANRGDIRVGMHLFGGGSVLAYSGFPNGGDTVMNGSVNWNQPANNYRFLRNVIAHEFGHGIGLQHNCPQNNTKLMEPDISLGFDGPQHDDIRGAQRHYGDRFEINDTTATATPLGAVTTAVTIDDISLDDDTDADVFSFVAGPNMQTTIRVFPTGSTYLDAAQAGDGTCPAGTPLDSFTVLDLRLRLIDTNGLTVLLTVDDNPAGGAERIIDYVLPSAGTFFARVSGAGANDLQTYRLIVQLDPVATPTCPGNLNGDTTVDTLDLGILLSSWTLPPATACSGTSCAADLNADGVVNSLDLGIMLSHWGPC